MMGPISRKSRRINVIFPIAVLDALDGIVPARQRDHFIVEATEQALQRAQLDRALQDLRETAAWRAEDHPEIRTVEDVDRFVRILRTGWADRMRDSDDVDRHRKG